MRAGLLVMASAVAVAGRAHAERLVIASDKLATLVEAGATSAKIVATIKLAANVDDVVWTGADPIAALDDGSVGALTAKGFVAIKLPPPTTFAVPRPNDGVQKLDHPQRKLIASTAGELWVGRCDWGFFPDGMTVCDDWVYARLAAGARLISRAAPADGAARWRGWSTVAAPAGVAVTFAKRPHGEHRMPDDAETMTCRRGGVTATFPDDEDAWTSRDSLRWISSDPPIFVVDWLADGFQGIARPTVFEGCAKSSRFTDAPFAGPPESIPQQSPSQQPLGVEGYTGPDDLFVLATTNSSSLRRHGKELLALPGAGFVVFAPVVDVRAPSAASDAFALLEREIAGDASMFAPDAIVLAPLPSVGAPALAKHADARIERFQADELGDAHVLVAELVLDGKPVRTMQLIDANHRVIAATWAPIKSLAAGGAAPTIPSPTPPGPLASLAASPAAAKQAAYNGTAVFGTDFAEHAVGREYGPDLLAKWSKLAFALDPSAREVHSGSYGYAVASVTLGKSRMIAFVIGAPDAKRGWKLAAIHYLAL